MPTKQVTLEQVQQRAAVAGLTVEVISKGEAAAIGDGFKVRRAGRTVKTCKTLAEVDQYLDNPSGSDDTSESVSEIDGSRKNPL
ncbi:MAG: hypothetical protein AAFO83_01715 [Cyanobacteria bacterium J06607_13]